MADFYHAVVNRVSMGVQSLDDNILKFLGREHSVAEALSAMETVRHSFDNFSIDLIYAIAGQTMEAEKYSVASFDFLIYDICHFINSPLNPVQYFFPASARVKLSLLMMITRLIFII